MVHPVGPIVCTYSAEVVDDPDFTAFIFQMILNVVVFHVRDDVFRHCLTILHLELIRVLCGAQTTKYMTFLKQLRALLLAGKTTVLQLLRASITCKTSAHETYKYYKHQAKDSFRWG